MSLSERPVVQRPRGRADEVLDRIEQQAAEGRCTDALRAGRMALAAGGLPPAVEARVRVLVASCLQLAGRTADADAEAAVVLHEVGAPQRVQLEAAVIRLRAAMADGDWDRGRALAEEVMAGGDGPSADLALAGSLTAIGLAAWDAGRVEEALRWLRAAVRRGAGGPPEARAAHPRLALATVLAAIGRFDEAERSITAARRDVEALGEGGWSGAATAANARLLLYRGRRDEAESEARTALEEGLARGTTFFAPWLRAVLGAVAFRRGDLAAARSHLRVAEDELVAVPSARTSWIWEAARVAEAEDGPEAALELLRPVYEDPGAHARLLASTPAVPGWLVRTALAGGDRLSAEGVATAAGLVAAGNPGLAILRAAAVHAAALLAAEPEAIAGVAAQLRHPWARGSASEDAAALFLAAGRRERARHELGAARAAYRAAGSDRDAARIDERLRENVPCRRAGTAVPNTPLSRYGLTAAELRVAETVAEGLTNREVGARLYLSHHTLDFHLRQIYRKLGVASRVALTRFIVQTGAAAGREDHRAQS